MEHYKNLVRHRIRLYLVIGLCCLSFAQAEKGSAGQPLSSRPADFAWLNTQAAAAVAAGENWPQDVLSLLQRFWGNDYAQTLHLELHFNSPENPSSATVRAIRDGFLDDSVRGIWQHLTLVRQADGSWRIGDAREAYRCRRGTNTSDYRADLCP